MAQLSVGSGAAEALVLGPEPSVQEGASEKPSGGEWQRDEDVAACPLCGARFSTTYRRHHCRQCGGIVCDACSPHRLRIPSQANLGKVRFCNPCAREFGEKQASGFEEDLDVSAEIISQLRGTLVCSCAEHQTFKHMLIDLVAEAGVALVQNKQDHESDELYFNMLKELASGRWMDVCSGLAVAPDVLGELGEAYEEASQRHAAASNEADGLIMRRSEFDNVHSEMLEAEEQRDTLHRRKGELEEAVQTARKRVLELENERREMLERQKRQRLRVDVNGRPSFRHNSSRSPTPGGAPLLHGGSASSVGIASVASSATPGAFGGVFDASDASPRPFTIARGRGDSLFDGDSRLGGCRRRCTTM